MRGGLAALLIVVPVLLLGRSANSEDRPSAFVFYVLSLSWSPSFCLTEAGRQERLQCGPGRRHGFIVHCLWPRVRDMALYARPKSGATSSASSNSRRAWRLASLEKPRISCWHHSKRP
jgi:ribonuclease I